MICLPLMTKDVERLFVYLVAICICLENVCSSPLLIFKLGCLLFCWCYKKSLYSPDTGPLLDVYMVCIYFLLISCLPFIFLTLFFENQEFWFWWCPSFIASFICIAFCKLFKKSQPNPCLLKFSPVFFQKCSNFSLTFGSVIH